MPPLVAKLNLVITFKTCSAFYWDYTP